jgi:hypothetical protein
MKQFIFVFLISGTILANGDDELPPVCTPPATPRQGPQESPVLSEQISPFRLDPPITPGTGSSFLHSVESQYEVQEMSSNSPPFPFWQSRESTENRFQGTIFIHIENILNTLTSARINFVELLTEINELSMYHFHVQNLHQQQLLRIIANTTDADLRVGAMLQFIAAIVARDSSVQAYVNSDQFRTALLNEYHAVERLQDQLRELEQHSVVVFEDFRRTIVDFEAFRRLVPEFSRRVNRIPDENERNLLIAITHEDRVIIREHLIIQWLEMRYVSRDIINEFITNLGNLIESQGNLYLRNPRELRALAEQARAIGYTRQAVSIEANLILLEGLRSTQPSWMSLGLASGNLRL